jgi:hypothetical protein
MPSQDWGDPAASVAQSIMDVVQVNQGNTPDGRPRNAAPYFVFGETEHDAGTPGSSIAAGFGGTILPSVTWRQDDGHFTFNRHVPNGVASGTIGSWVQGIRARVTAADRRSLDNETLYLLQAFQQFTWDPPLSNVTTRYIQAKAQGNQKAAWEVSFDLALKVPYPPVVYVPITEVLVSGSFVTGSVSSSFAPPPVPANTPLTFTVRKW